MRDYVNIGYHIASRNKLFIGASISLLMVQYRKEFSKIQTIKIWAYINP